MTEEESDDEEYAVLPACDDCGWGNCACHRVDLFCAFCDYDWHPEPDKIPQMTPVHLDGGTTCMGSNQTPLVKFMEA